MKTNVLLSIFAMSIFTTCGTYHRMGSLTMVSTRNVDSGTEYALVKRDVTAKANTNGGDALQQAIDNAVKQSSEGEFMKNVVIYVKSNGNAIKVTGDVWGVPSVKKRVISAVELNVNYKIGDKVAFKSKSGKIVNGTIVGINTSEAIVEHPNMFGKIIQSGLGFESLTKLE